jgi:hypothetical protein
MCNAIILCFSVDFEAYQRKIIHFGFEVLMEMNMEGTIFVGCDTM